jgi:hypothetical protein
MARGEGLTSLLPLLGQILHKENDPALNKAHDHRRVMKQISQDGMVKIKFWARFHNFLEF